jgi:hypothetical protein
VEVDSRDVESKTCVVAQRDRPGGLMCVREDLTLIFLSAEPDTKSVESEEMSKESTGSLWPYKDRKNLRLSVKNT